MVIPATINLRAELKHRRSGEDDHTTIERWRERCHNLDGDYGVANAAPDVANAAHTPTSLSSGGRCMALAPHLQMVVWPRKF
jgi:hypothetical protein